VRPLDGNGIPIPRWMAASGEVGISDSIRGQKHSPIQLLPKMRNQTPTRMPVNGIQRPLEGVFIPSEGQHSGSESGGLES